MNAYPSKLHELEVQRRQLEKLWQPTPAQRLRGVSYNWFHIAGQWLVKVLTEGDQLRIWTQDTKQGTCWYVYIPMDGMYHQFKSEEALRMWLEQRHNS